MSGNSEYDMRCSMAMDGYETCHTCGWLAELKYIPGISSNKTVAYLQHLEHRVRELEKD